MYSFIITQLGIVVVALWCGRVVGDGRQNRSDFLAKKSWGAQHFAYVGKRLIEPSALV